MKSTAQSIDKRSALNPAADIIPHAIQATDGVTVKETPMNLLERVQAVGDEMKSLASEALASGDAEVFAALADVGFDVTLVDPYEAQQNVSDVLEAWLCAPMWDRLEEWNANAEPIWHDVAFRVFYETRTDLSVARQILDWGSRDLASGLYDHFTENDFEQTRYEEAGAIDLFNAKLKLLEGGGGEEDHDADESDEEVEHVPGCREQGAHEEVRTGEGGALCAAIDQDNLEWAGEILDAGGDVNAYHEDGRKPLHHACHDVEWVEMLLWSGAEVDASDCNGVTPLTQAAYDGGRAVLEALIGAGAKITGTALHQAARLKDFDRAKDNILCLVENGADPWARDEAGMTAAETARQVGNLALAAFIDSTWPVVRDQITAGEAEA